MKKHYDLYDALIITLEKMKEMDQLTELELRVLKRELELAQQQNIPFDVHQNEYTHKERWVTVEIGTKEELERLDEYIKTATPKRIVTPERTPLSQNELFKKVYPRTYRRISHLDFLYG